MKTIARSLPAMPARAGDRNLFPLILAIIAGLCATAVFAQPVITERGPHHRNWSRFQYLTNRTGQVTILTNLAYVELATGLHRLDPQTGHWVDARETIEPVSGGALARQGQNIVFFANDLATAGAIRLQSTDGKTFASTPLGLAFFDAASGNNVLIAQVKSCQGEIIQNAETNQVIYDDAMTQIPCSVRYTYTRAGLEQDIILTDPAHLPSPADYGLNPATSRLVVLTEFFTPPQPSKQVITNSGPATLIADESLNFGVMQIGAGQALYLGTNAGVPILRIYKQWTQLDGRNFLLEQIPVPKLFQALSAIRQNPELLT
jgi:hypothetical protein